VQFTSWPEGTRAATDAGPRPGHQQSISPMKPGLYGREPSSPARARSASGRPKPHSGGQLAGRTVGAGAGPAGPDLPSLQLNGRSELAMRGATEL
jgi:hypothetical protein